MSSAADGHNGNGLKLEKMRLNVSSCFPVSGIAVVCSLLFTLNTVSTYNDPQLNTSYFWVVVTQSLFLISTEKKTILRTKSHILDILTLRVFLY